MPGWGCSTREVRSLAELPELARRYVERIEEVAGAKVDLISVGPERDQTIWRRQSW
ncbi:Adenylosuccinate synthetase [mine drainage metagenome]|uniref:Adenylosuccinate synthetase n=1 Tax=mine drainage metagenome TaxID=410659 RepID=T1C869_9ZZZZ